MLAKAAAVAVSVALVALGTFLGLIVGVAVGGGGIELSKIAAITLHLTFLGWAIGAFALALATSTGRRGLAAGTAAAIAVLGFLLNGFAPLVDVLDWLRYLSLFYYYEGHDPIANGVDAGDLAVLAAATISLTAIALIGIRNRDLRN